MRILHAAISAEGATLGREKEVATLAVAQKARGSDVMIAIDRPGIFTESCLECGVPVVVCDRLAVCGQLQGLLKRLVTPEEVGALENAMQGFVECVESFGPDIIHCHGSGAEALVAIGAGNRLGVPCAFTSAGPSIAVSGWKSGLRFGVLCSAVHFGELLESEIPDANVYCVPNGTRAVPPKQVQQTGTGHSPSLTVAGSLAAKKGIDVLILAMLELRRRLGRACPLLNIYGDGPRKKYLTEMVAVLELNDVVQFHGFKLGILEDCPNSDILVLPSRFEGSPLVVLEAMSRGMPIVATDVGEVANMLPDWRYGHVVPKDAVMPLADAIELLLQDIADGRFNPDLLIERHRSLYSIEKFAERTEAAYRQILLNNSATAQQPPGSPGIPPRATTSASQFPPRRF